VARQRSAVRAVFFSLLAMGLFFGGLEAAAWLLGRTDVVSTASPDDRVLFVDGELFRLRGEEYGTTRLAHTSLVPSTFPADKGDAWRAFVLGGSLAMGSPYTNQGQGVEHPGGVSSWLRAGLASAKTGPVEVINVAAGAQSSHRVLRIAQEVVRYEPDLLIVLTGNNEGIPDPAALREVAHRFASYRLLRALVAPPTATGERPLHTPQLLPPE